MEQLCGSVAIGKIIPLPEGEGDRRSWWRGIIRKLTGPPETIAFAKKLRRAMSLPEALLWRELKKRPSGLKFRKQHPAGPYVLDFYCPAIDLAIEIDGEAHARGARPSRDAERDRWLASRKVRVLRIPAREVLEDLEAVVRHIVGVARG